jgi:hypothetical protein
MPRRHHTFAMTAVAVLALAACSKSESQTTSAVGYGYNPALPAPNKTLLPPSANRITLLRDADGDGVAETKHGFLRGSIRPSAWPWSATRSTSPTPMRSSQLPVRGGRRPASPPAAQGAGPAGRADQPPLDQEPGRQPRRQQALCQRRLEQQCRRERHRSRGRPRGIWEVDGHRRHRVFASGLRNPNGMAWEPPAAMLWTVGQRARRDRQRPGARLHDLGARRRLLRLALQLLRPARRRSAVKSQRPDLVAKAIGAGLRAGRAHRLAGPGRFGWQRLPALQAHGMFVGQHGSWNRKPHSGYKVVFVPFVERQAGRHAGRCADRFPERQGRGDGPAGRRGAGQAWRAAGGRRRRQRDLARQ